MSEESTRENRLGGETSPYLRLHRHNPVDWYPWGEEAFEKARSEDKPIFLSVGYSTCYWCHVMERESFSDPRIAERMNRDFVNVKVDREERPDVDEIYMAATQLLTHQGGWPNSVFLTPGLEPFYAGTYFPPFGKYGRPGFADLLAGLAEAWRDRRTEVEMQAEELVRVMRRFLEERGEGADSPPGGELAAASLATLEQRFDAEHGGFGGAPKFPTPANLFLLHEMAADSEGAARMLDATLDAMARGGIFDHVGGGFHRYATDHEWKVPHFEKMLYDNALLLEVYALAAERTGDPEPERIVRETVAFLDRELSDPGGGFWSALDAETDGREGAFHVWTREQLDAALGPEDAEFLAPILGFDGPPFFEGHHYVLHLPLPLGEQAARRHRSRDELIADLEPLRRRLFEARSRRPALAVDDKVLTDWNGMAIRGLAVAGRVLGDRAMVDRAVRAADFVERELWPDDGPLRHSWRDGEARVDAMLADYVFFARGLLALREATGEERWLRLAVRCLDEMRQRLAEPRGGYATAGETPDLLFRSREIFDGALPAANATAVLAFLECAEATGDAVWLERAGETLRAFAATAASQPEGVRTLALAARRFERAGGAEGPASTAPADLDLEATARSRIEIERTALGKPDGAGWRRIELALHPAAGWHLELDPGVDVSASGGEVRGWSAAGEGPPVRLAGEARADAPGARLRVRVRLCEEGRCLPAVDLEVPVG